jgi:hypothetical protein
LIYPALQLTQQLTAQLLQHFTTVRPGTEVFVHNMLGNKPQRLDPDVRRLRLHFLPEYTFGQVALFNRVPYDSISLRDCTANREGFVIMWQPSEEDHDTPVPGGPRDTKTTL